MGIIALQGVLSLVVWYQGPGQDHKRNNSLDVETGLDGMDGGNGWDDDLSDDQRALLNLEQNIANLERSMSASHLGQMERTQGRSMQRQVKQ